MLYSEYEEFRDKFIEPHVKLIRYSLPAIIFETERYGMIFDKFNKRQEIFSDRMKHPTSPLLDRHKIAACICVAICDARPFEAPAGKSVSYLARRANEFLAVQTALNILETYIAYDMEKEELLNNPPKIEFPPPVKDKKGYIDNLISCLHYSRINGEMPHPWWLSQIFYFIDVYSRGN